MKKLRLMFLLFSLSVTTLFAQVELPSNFTYSRATGQKSGIPGYMLGLASQSIEYDLINNNPFEALTGFMQPERDYYLLLFINCKPALSLRRNVSKGAALTIDGEKFEYKSYKIKTEMKRKPLRLGIEMAEFEISREVFVKLIKADDVTVRVGSVFYNLDKDNVDALRYLAAEINQDLKRRKKPPVE